MVATKSKSKTKATAQSYYRDKMASRQAEALQRGTARVNKAAKTEEAKVKRDIKKAFDVEMEALKQSELLRRAAERAVDQEEKNKPKPLIHNRNRRAAMSKNRPDTNETQRATQRATQREKRAETARRKREAREEATKEAEAMKEAAQRAATRDRNKTTPRKTRANPKSKSADYKSTAEKTKAAQREKRAETARRKREARQAREAREAREEAMKEEEESVDDDLPDLEDIEDLEENLAAIGIDISTLSLDEIKRIAPLAVLLPKMSSDQIKEALSFSTFSPDGRPILRSNIKKPRKSPRNTRRFVLDNRGKRIYIG